MSRVLLLASATAALAATAAACGDARFYVYDKPTSGPQSSCPNSKVNGYAALGGTDADGGVLAPTTGGNDTTFQQMMVSDPDALATALQRPDPLIIIVDGMLAPAETIKVTINKSSPGGNKTLIGLGDSSGLTGAGLDLSYASNVIVRNLKISKVTIGEGDAITLLASHHVWIDHCDLSSDRSDITSGYDGLVDITHGSSYVTVSWTRFHDHRDTSLVGHTNDPAQKAEDSALSVTYHHNLWFNVETGPRVRWGTAHVYSNHFDTVGTFGVASESLATVLVNYNFFEDNVTMPITTTFQDPMSGTMTEASNRFPGGVPPDIIQATPAVTVPYAFSQDSADTVSKIVSDCAGTGKINLSP